VLSQGYVPIMLVTGAATRVYLAIGATDMRSFQRNLARDLMFGIRLCVLTDAMICRKVVSAAQKCWLQFMSSDAGSYELYLAVPEGADDQELDEHRRNLQRELNELDEVDRVDQIGAGKAPDNARAIDLVIVGALAVALKKSGAFDAIVSVLKAWIERGNRRREKRKVVIKRPDGSMLEFDGYSLKEIGKFENPSDKGNKP
jgi:hypothetical protein